MNLKQLMEEKRLAIIKIQQEYLEDIKIQEFNNLIGEHIVLGVTADYKTKDFIYVIYGSKLSNCSIGNLEYRVIKDFDGGYILLSSKCMKEKYIVTVNTLVKERRYGIIKLGEDILAEVGLNDLNNSLKDFFILDSNYDYPTRTFRYRGVSEYFRPLEEGEEIPQYTTTMEVLKNAMLEGVQIKTDFKEN